MTWSSTSFYRGVLQFSPWLIDSSTTKKSHSERFSRQPVPNARALDTDHIFGQREVVTPKTPYCQLLRQLASRVIYSLLNRQWSLRYISYIVGLGSSSTFTNTLQFDERLGITRDIVEIRKFSLFLSLQVCSDFCWLVLRRIMDEKESNKRENSMLGPQGTGHAQIFAKGDSPLAVSGAARSRLQPEGHTNISRSEADLEIRVSDFESTASGGSGALFPTSGEQELLSGEKLQDPLQTVKTPVFGGSQSEGRHSSPKHFLATLLSVSHRGDQGASEKVTLSADVDEKVD